MTTMRFSDLRLSTFNPRKKGGLDPASIRELAIHIGLHGLLNALLVTSDGVVIGGERRCRAIQWLIMWFGPNFGNPRPDHDEESSRAIAELTHADVSVIERRAVVLYGAIPVNVVGSVGVEGLALADNLQREDLSSFEIAQHLEFLSEKGATGKDLARLIGKSTSYVSRKLAAFRGASPELRAAWERGDLVEDQVQGLAEQSHAKQAKVLGAGDLPKRGVANRPKIELVKDVLVELEVRPAAVGAQLAIGAEARSVAYTAGVLDALRWVAGRKASEDFAKLVGGGS